MSLALCRLLREAEALPVRPLFEALRIAASTRRALVSVLSDPLYQTADGLHPAQLPDLLDLLRRPGTVALETIEIDAASAAALPNGFMAQLMICPVRTSVLEGHVTLAMADPRDDHAASEASHHLGVPVVVAFASPSQIREALERANASASPTQGGGARRALVQTDPLPGRPDRAEVALQPPELGARGAASPDTIAAPPPSSVLAAPEAETHEAGPTTLPEFGRPVTPPMSRKRNFTPVWGSQSTSLDPEGARASDATLGRPDSQIPIPLYTGSAASVNHLDTDASGAPPERARRTTEIGGLAPMPHAAPTPPSQGDAGPPAPTPPVEHAPPSVARRDSEPAPFSLWRAKETSADQVPRAAPVPAAAELLRADGGDYIDRLQSAEGRDQVLALLLYGSLRVAERVGIFVASKGFFRGFSCSRSFADREAVRALSLAYQGQHALARAVAQHGYLGPIAAIEEHRGLLEFAGPFSDDVALWPVFVERRPAAIVCADGLRDTMLATRHLGELTHAAGRALERIIRTR